MSWDCHTVVMGRTGSGKTHHVNCEIIPQFRKKSILYWLGGHDDVRLRIPFVNVTGCHDVGTIKSLLSTKKIAVCYTPAFEQERAKKELKYWQEYLMSGQRELLFVLDEAQRYAPQGSIDTAAHILATGARKFGITCVFVCQRVAELSKTIASQCRHWVIFEHSIIDENYLKERGILLTDEEVDMLRNKKYHHVTKEV